MNIDETLPLADTAPLADTLPFEGSGTVADVDSTASAPPPRTRWAAIIWGLVFAAVAWGGIWMLSDTARRHDVTDWLGTLDPGSITAFALLTVGALVLVGGMVGLIRRAQRMRSSQ